MVEFISPAQVADTDQVVGCPVPVEYITPGLCAAQILLTLLCWCDPVQRLMGTLVVVAVQSLAYGFAQLLDAVPVRVQISSTLSVWTKFVVF